MEQERRVCGIDVSREALDVAMGAEAARFANDAGGIAALVKWAGQHKVTLAAMEATGRYEMDVAIALDQAGIAAAILNPRAVRRFAEAGGKLEKTDAIDARVIEQFARAFDVRRAQLPDAARRELMASIARRRQLIELITAERNRLQQCRSSKMKRSLEQTIRFLRKQVESIDEDIDTRIRKNEAWNRQAELLESIPGVGRVTASTLVAELPELLTLTSRQLAKLVGVAPLARDSGKMKGPRQIHGGRASVRAKLYMAALVATKHNVVIKATYERLLARGKEKKVAITACMNKLLKMMRSVCVRQKPWSASGTLENTPQIPAAA